MKTLIFLYVVAALTFIFCGCREQPAEKAAPQTAGIEAVPGASNTTTKEHNSSAQAAASKGPSYILRMRFYDSQRSNSIDTIAPLMLYRKWTTDAGIYPAFEVTDGEHGYYVNESRLMSVNLRTGKSDKICDTPFEKATLVLSGNGRVVYCVHCVQLGVIFPHGTFSSTAAAIDTRTGKIIWKLEHNESDPFVGQILALDDDILIFLTTKNMTAINAQNGKETWSIPFITRQFLWPMSQTAGVIAAWRNEQLVGIDAKSGKELWSVPSSKTGGLIQADERRFYITYPDPQSKPSVFLVIDAKSGKIVEQGHPDTDKPSGSENATIPDALGGVQRMGNWQIVYEAGFDYAVRNIQSGKIYRQLEGTFPTSMAGRAMWQRGIPIFYTAIDGYCILPSRGATYPMACFEDMRFHPDAAKMIFDIRPEMLDEKMKARIAKLIKELDADNYDTRSAAEKELTSLLDLPEEQIRAALKGEPSHEVSAACANLLKSIEKYVELRKYLDELGCRKDPIFFTALIRHTADLAIQQKAIDRLKKIIGRDFGLKPSAEWIKDQKEASDKYDDWWLKNRDKLSWSDKEDRYELK